MIMRMSASDWRTLGEYARIHDLRPQLSVPASGIFIFLDAQNKEIQVALATMTNEIKERKNRDKES